MSLDVSTHFNSPLLNTASAQSHMTVGCRNETRKLNTNLTTLDLELRVCVYGPYWMGKDVACADITSVVKTKIQEVVHTDSTFTTAIALTGSPPTKWADSHY